MPTDLWAGQLFAGSMTSGAAHHYEHGFDYVTPEERTRAARRLSIRSVFSHIVPDYGRLLTRGLRGIMEDVARQRCPRRRRAPTAANTPFSTRWMSSSGVIGLRRTPRGALQRGRRPATLTARVGRMAVNLRQVPWDAHLRKRSSPSGCS